MNFFLNITLGFYRTRFNIHIANISWQEKANYDYDNIVSVNACILAILVVFALYYSFVKA